MRRFRCVMGLTLIEVLVALTVLAVVAALVYPIARGMRIQMLKETCVNNLRRIGGVVVAYREDWDGMGRYGAPWAMGLPPGIRAAIRKEESKQYPECPVPFPKGRYYYLDMYPGPGGEPWDRERLPFWVRHVKKMKERAVIFVCDYHNYGKGYDPKFGIGLLLGGDVVTRWGRVRRSSYAFWED